MDWSSVFEDEGEEDGDWTRGDDPSSRTGMLQSIGMQGNYGPLICYAFTVNYILGVGCLGIPYAFLQSGILMGSILVIFLSFISYVTVLWIAIATQQEMSISIYRATTNPFILSPHTTLARRKRLLTAQRKQDEKAGTLAESAPLLHGSSSFRNLYSNLSTSLQNAISTTSSRKEDAVGSNGVSGGSQQSSKKRSQSDLKSEKLLMIAIEKEGMNMSSQSLNSSRRRKSPRRSSVEEDLSRSIHELEVTDLAEEFLGAWGKFIYQASLMALTYVGLLAYTQVFNDTFRSQLFPTAPSYLPPLLFGIIVIPLSCFDLSEQVFAQVLMSILRFLSLGILLIGTIVALFTDWNNSLLHEALDSPSSSLEITDASSHYSSIFYANFSGFGVMFTTAIFSQLFQHSVPGLIRPLKEEHKKFIPQIFAYALLTTTIIYILSGTFCVLYFGSHLQQSVNLNFIDFTWGVRASPQNGSIISFITCLAMTVVLFPALDTLSVFPLIAITLGNNLHAAFPQVDNWLKQLPVLATYDKKLLRKWTSLLWRLVAAIPPVILSVVVTNLVVSLQIAGLCGIIVALVTPALLHQQTQYRIELIPSGMKITTLAFPDAFNNSLYVNTVLGIAAVAAVVSVGQMVW